MHNRGPYSIQQLKLTTIKRNLKYYLNTDLYHKVNSCEGHKTL